MVDRISALPDDLLCHILSFLPTKLAVRTSSVLSTRWRFLHNLISSIDIDLDLRGCLYEEKSRILNYVERNLFCPNRKSIQKFRLEWHHFIDLWKICRWINALLCHNIQELELCINYASGEPPLDVQKLPSSLFSSKTLVVLKLVLGVVDDIRSLRIPAEAFLPNLKVLHIVGTSILGDQVENLLSSCPVLDDLVLNDFFPYNERESPYKLNISNAILKRLTICILPMGRDAQVVINSPTLEYLKFCLHNKDSLVLLATQSLVEVVIDGYSSERFANKAHDVLNKINNIHSLQILVCTLQGIYDRNFGLPLFNKLTYLKLYDSVILFDARYLEHLLTRCVVLKTLVFEPRRISLDRVVTPAGPKQRIEYSLQRSRLVGLLCHLKVIKFHLGKIKRDDCKALRKIIEFFLNNAEVLEELTVQVRDFQSMQKSDIMLELLAIPTVSKNCRVVANYDWRR